MTYNPTPFWIMEDDMADPFNNNTTQIYYCTLDGNSHNHNPNTTCPRHIHNSQRCLRSHLHH